ncbi:uncharacterized protein LOC117535995 isoform X2 [Gymnodraco acuticeps]|uniref:Uncharacterized protein LOC117535995 isoform X2 n=1 Tax=Gymnodraco acuticeps TaxID=8218 RepID=A0A6P8TEW4_GYMAC|nr:uncharacterized protein LOC117535995 isoform X2 [Gymnodraco acuticeps]
MDSFVTKTKRVRLEVVQGEQGTVSTSESAEGSVVDTAGGVEAAGAGVEAGTAPHHRKSGWNPDWLKDPLFNTWLYNTKNGMFCRLCRLHKPPHTKGPRQRSFIEAGYTVYRKDVIQHHLKSELHQYSVGKQASLASGLSVVQAFEPNIVMEHEAIIGGFKCLYWLMKNEISHHNNYPKLLSLTQLLGCSYFAKLKLDQRSNYHSHRIVDEMLEILAKIVESSIMEKMRVSAAIGLEVDETTDVSVIRQLDLHVRLLDKDGLVYTHFLDLVPLDDGKADTVVAAIKRVIQEKGLPTNKLYGLGTDGAAVMTGRLNGVAKQLTDDIPWLVAVACAAHRLALACKGASETVKYMATFRNHLQDLHLFFRNSANRSAALHNAATTLGLSDLKVKEVKDTRWLSQEMAVQNLRRNLPAVLSALADEATTRKCPIAKGLYTFCATYRFVAALYLQADVLPHICLLSKVFQKANVNFLHIKTQPHWQPSGVVGRQARPHCPGLTSIGFMRTWTILWDLGHSTSATRRSGSGGDGTGPPGPSQGRAVGQIC